MSATETIQIPHLGGSTIGYRLGKAYDPSLPTLVMVKSFTTSVELYRPQFADEQLCRRREPPRHRALRARADPRHLRAVHLLGHGHRRTAGARRARHPPGLRPRHLAGRVDRGTHGHARPRRGRGHHPAGHLDGLREPAQPRAWVLGRRRLLHPRHRGTGHGGRRRLGLSRSSSSTPRSPKAWATTSRTTSARSGTARTRRTTPATPAGSGSGSPALSTSATGTACTAGWTAFAAPSSGCTAPLTGSTR